MSVDKIIKNSEQGNMLYKRSQWNCTIKNQQQPTVFKSAAGESSEHSLKRISET